MAQTDVREVRVKWISLRAAYSRSRALRAMSFEPRLQSMVVAVALVLHVSS